MIQSLSFIRFICIGEKDKMKVTMLGCGYVGLVSGACFAEFGASVTCFDIDKTKVDKLLAGEIPIYEPGLDALVEKNVKQGRSYFTII